MEKCPLRIISDDSSPGLPKLPCLLYRGVTKANYQLREGKFERVKDLFFASISPATHVAVATVETDIDWREKSPSRTKHLAWWGSFPALRAASAPLTETTWSRMQFLTRFLPAESSECLSMVNSVLPVAQAAPSLRLQVQHLYRSCPFRSGSWPQSSSPIFRLQMIGSARLSHPLPPEH